MGFHKKSVFSRFLGLCFLLIIVHLVISDRVFRNPISVFDGNRDNGGGGDCRSAVGRFSDYKSKCEYVKTHGACLSKGYLNYLVIFYCAYSDHPFLGFSILGIWLLILFYVLGDTSSEYFCPSVAHLSRILKLSPTIAGTTLLPLGNGANDVFSSIISFTRSGNGDVGLNSILGGAFFISCFVVGIVSISVSSKQITVEKASFIRDTLFFLFALCCLLAITLIGKINLCFALCFVALYAVYIASVSVMHLGFKGERVMNPPIADELETPLLGFVDEEKGFVSDVIDDDGGDDRWWWWLCVLDLPLSLPRKLTIPVVAHGHWSRTFAVSSATLSPILLATLFNTQLLLDDDDTDTGGCSSSSTLRMFIYIAASCCGVVLGGVSFLAADPRRFLFPWLAGGFVMSVAWTYIIVEELVSMLVSLGDILGISPSILGLTVLAWGNSLSDLVSNVAMAVRGGEDGVQVAVSGCYAGPLFNTLVGLGVSLVLASWKEEGWYSVGTGDGDVCETMGFLMGGVLWAVVMLPRRGMKPDKFLGVGLL
ncbi:hypothetical protein M569_16020, partial [Genlisea aurea]